MKTHISVQERLKDLRVERGLKLEELAEQTGISKSALGSYENDDYKEIGENGGGSAAERGGWNENPYFGAGTAEGFTGGARLEAGRTGGADRHFKIRPRQL